MRPKAETRAELMKLKTAPKVKLAKLNAGTEAKLELTRAEEELAGLTDQQVTQIVGWAELVEHMVV